MKLKIDSSRLWTATLLGLAGVASFAASSYPVTPAQESQIQIGMTSDEVRQIIGRPFNTVLFKSHDGPTWEYHVSGDNMGSKTFYVDFDALGKVASTVEINMPVSADSASN